MKIIDNLLGQIMDMLLEILMPFLRRVALYILYIAVVHELMIIVEVHERPGFGAWQLMKRYVMTQ